jgi:hypothetical protein
MGKEKSGVDWPIRGLAVGTTDGSWILYVWKREVTATGRIELSSTNRREGVAHESQAEERGLVRDKALEKKNSRFPSLQL